MQINAAQFHRSVHLKESDILPSDMPITKKCSFCGSIDRKPVWRLQDDPPIELLACQNCHAATASRLPTETTLAEYYSTYYDTDVTKAQDSAVTFDTPIRLARRISKYVPIDRRDCHVSILDFGGGDGTIAYLTASQLLSKGAAGVNITVVDFMQNTVSASDSRVTIEYSRDLESLQQNSFSVVIASAVLEHFPAPGPVLKDLLSRVKAPQGVFYARTPYMLPIMRALERLGMHIDFTYPGHIHDLGQPFWETYFSTKAPAFHLLRSQPSIVETSLGAHFLRTVAAKTLKLPWWLLRARYPFVGGWEVVAMRYPSGDQPETVVPRG